MDRALLDLHSSLRWIILIFLLALLVRSWSSKPFSGGDRKIALVLLISAHLTLVIGLYQWLFGRYGILVTSLPPGVQLMKDTFYRFYWIEHPFGMVVGITLITMAYGRVKRGVGQTPKKKGAAWLLLVALVVILGTIPWPFMMGGVARPLLPGM